MSKVLLAADTGPRSSVEEHRQLVQRIAESSQFRKSPRMREFLLFISEQAFQGRTQELTEPLIGCQVFGRPQGYNQAEDNIVRVSARQLRSKLKAYFDSEGMGEEYVLEVPKGGYVPVFHLVAPGAEPLSKISRGTLVWIAATAVAAAILAIALSLWMWRESKILTAATTPSSATLVGELLLTSNKPVTVVIADFGLVMMESLGGRAVPLEDYVKREYVAGSPRDQSPGMLGVWRTLATRQITSFDDMTLGTRLFKAHPDHREQIVMRHSRSMNIRDFKTGQFIIQGGNLSTPWTTLFDQHLNFRLAPESWGPVYVSNLHPKPGEKSKYVSAGAPIGGETSYARIALVPNLSGTGKVLMVAGCNIAGNEAAAEFLLAPSSVPLVKSTLSVSDLSQISYFEILLETSTLDGAGRGARIVAFRR